MRLLVVVWLAVAALRAEDGYELWLRYRPEPNAARRAEYQAGLGAVVLPGGNRPTLAAARAELERAVPALAGGKAARSGRIRLGTPADGPEFRGAPGPEGYAVTAARGEVTIAGYDDAGVLYGTFALLKSLQQGVPLAGLHLVSAPRVPLRLANHWDNPVIGTDGWAVERGYAGASLFDWKQIGTPGADLSRLRDYARLLAALGLNGTDVNNVNTAKHGLEGWRLLTPEWRPKVAALAAILRPYHVRLYLSVNFFSPKLLGGLPTADPLDPRVAAWWRATADALYAAVPDFGGWVVKADSENEPGPYAYGRTHADGANVMAAALQPHGGHLFWRAFVYTEKGDRVTDAYRNFRDLDGKFAANAFVQVKNGPLDFQIREPVSALLGALPRTHEAFEVQVSQEYTGQNREVCYLAPIWHEALAFDTHAQGDGSTVARRAEAIAGVMNLGADRNWTGSLLAQANTFAFGRLAWDPEADPAEIADEWTRLTFGRDPEVVATVTHILLASREVFEGYTAPYGLGLMAARGNHFDPAPAYRQNYHHADAHGIGYDRTVATGSGYAGQYFEPWRSRFEAVETCPENLLLFFHHVPYGYRLSTGETVIQAIYRRHTEGVAAVHGFVTQWERLDGRIDAERYHSVLAQLQDQAGVAAHWRDAVNGYLRSVSGIPER